MMPTTQHRKKRAPADGRVLAWILFALGMAHIAYAVVKFRAPLLAGFSAGIVGLAASRARFLDGFSPEHTREIVEAGERVGLFVVKPLDDGVLLDHLYIRPSRQNRGHAFELVERTEFDNYYVRRPQGAPGQVVRHERQGAAVRFAHRVRVAGHLQP